MAIANADYSPVQRCCIVMCKSNRPGRGQYEQGGVHARHKQWFEQKKGAIMPRYAKNDFPKFEMWIKYGGSTFANISLSTMKLWIRRRLNWWLFT